jgi:tRNA threonylcarbamoyl adenosine modification protein YeaZ
MTTLIIDTATSRTSVGLFEGGAPLFAGRKDGATAHGQALPQLVSAALEVGKPISQVLIGMGPGPFTGLRVGIAFAQVFSQARKIPLLGISSLDGIVSGVVGRYIVATDARRKEIYWAEFDSGKRVSEPKVSKPDFVRELGLPVYGEGAQLYGFEADIDMTHPNPLLMLAALEWADRVELPMYLRKPDALTVEER